MGQIIVVISINMIQTCSNKPDDISFEIISPPSEVQFRKLPYRSLCRDDQYFLFTFSFVSWMKNYGQLLEDNGPFTAHNLIISDNYALCG